MNWGRWLLAAITALALGALAAYLILLPPYLPAAERKDFVLSDVTVVNPGQGRRDAQTIVIKDGLIAEVRGARPDDPPALCKGCIVMPGLSDAHVHTPPAIAFGNQRLFALMYLAHGVTSIRDVGQSDTSVASWARRVNMGAELGPRIYRCGPVIDGADPGWPSAISVLSPAAATKAVDDIAASGANCIKLYNHVGKPEYEAIRLAAAHNGLPVVGHVPHKVGLRGVVDYESQHLTGLPYLHRPPAWNNDIGDADLAQMTDAEVGEALAVAKQRRIALTPTIVNWRMRLSASDPARFPPPEAGKYLPGFWTPVWSVLVPHPKTEAEISIHVAAMKKAQEIVKRARETGIDVLAGTDVLMPWTLPGDALNREVAYLAEAFGSNEAALEAATRTNGRRLDKGRIGEVAAGKFADLLVLDADPVADLGAIRRWRFVIVDGRLYKREEIDAALARYQGHFHGVFYGAVFDFVASLLAGDYSTSGGRP